jgi:Ca-activated chloride channel family protein
VRRERVSGTLRPGDGIHPKIEPEIAFITARELRGNVSPRRRPSPGAVGAWAGMMRAAALVALAACVSCKCGAIVSGPALAPVTVTIAYGSEKKKWLDEQIKSFAGTTRSGRPIRVDARPMGSGEAMQAIVSGTLKPTVFSPASGAYVTLLNQAWLSTAGRTKALCPAGEPVVLSPIVIAMWKPMAQALGWPEKQLGWSDLLRVNAGKGWAALGHPEWGSFKLGHTHPEMSNSGLLAVLAEAYAGAKKTRGLSVADFDHKATRTFVTAVESTIVHYGRSTGFFAEKMIARGPSYLSAAVLYENLVIESYAESANPPIVSLYPVEGTFWSDHPWAVLDAEWVGPDEREGAGAFLAFLKARPAQERALQLGFRPADATIPISAPIDSWHGADPKQPQTLLEVPDAPVLRALLDLWQQSKRSADVALVFDKSGSMNGRPLEEAKEGAKAFLRSLHDGDEASLQLFDNNIYPPFGPVKIGERRASLIERIDQTFAGGGTSLYDATAAAVDAARERARKDPARIHAVVVMTDGRDQSSQMKLDELRARLASEDEVVKVFTIAYGSAADPAILAQIAEAARGTSLKGSAENIVQVYQEMASFF